MKKVKKEVEQQDKESKQFEILQQQCKENEETEYFDEHDKQYKQNEMENKEQTEEEILFILKEDYVQNFPLKANTFKFLKYNSKNGQGIGLEISYKEEGTDQFVWRFTLWCSPNDEPAKWTAASYCKKVLKKVIVGEDADKLKKLVKSLKKADNLISLFGRSQK